MKIFITGLAGMIGFHTAKHYSAAGWEVTGIDNFNDYYDIKLKRSREKILKDEWFIDIIDGDIQNIKDTSVMEELEDTDVVLHLAAYANPRHSFEEPQHYIDTNITGTQRVMEVCEETQTPIVYASSSCVMHGQPLPWNETDKPDHQNNAYGWSKRANECQFMHSKINKTAGLRFFTVYGPYGRPDMALFLFADAISKGGEMNLYNYGDMKRDFTFVEDIVQGISCVVKNICDMDRETVSHEIYNIGYGEQVQLLDFVDEIEKQFGRTAKRNLVAAHPADTPATWADTTKIKKLGYNPQTPIAVGVEKFVTWYKEYYGVN